MTNRIIGMGESILDILFKDGQPVAAVAGGSSFNSIVSVGRAGLPCAFVGFTGHDQVGTHTIRFLQDNGVDTHYFTASEPKSAISLAFLDSQGNASYSFYKPQVERLQLEPLPSFHRGDTLLFGSFYACQPEVRPLVDAVLREASAAGATVYYDLNFRPAHQHQLPQLRGILMENIRRSTIVRASDEDCRVVWGTGNPEEVYHTHIAPHCPLFVCTAGDGPITLCTPRQVLQVAVPPLDEVVSTVGAGDSFNAGVACAVARLSMTADELVDAGEDVWRQILHTAMRFARLCCISRENYIPRGVADGLFSTAG